VARGDGQPERPHPTTAAASEVAVTGRVLGPDGKPFAGAKLYLSYYGSREPRPKVRAVSGADGRFRFAFAKLEISEPTWRPEAWRVAAVVAVAPGIGSDWTPAARVEKGELTLRLVKDEYPIDGRILDTEGRPVAGVTVRRLEILTTAKEDLTPVLKAWSQQAYHAAVHLADKSLANLDQAELNQTATTGPDGRFRLVGSGRERMTKLRIEGPTIQSMTVYVAPRDPAAIKALNQAPSSPAMRALGKGPMVYGPRFDHVADPTKPIVGTVRERGTGKPLAGVKVWGSAEGSWWENWAEAWTDSRGRYRLMGLPKADRRQLFAVAREGEPYHPAAKVVQDSQGLEPLTVGFELERGVVVEGRMTDRKSGKPVQGIVSYVPLPDDERPRDTAAADSYKFSGHGSYVDREGKYRIVVLPGAGVLLAQSGAQEDNRYRGAHVDPADRKKRFVVRDEIQGGEYFAGLNGAQGHVRGANAYRLIHPPRGAASFTCNFQLDPGLAKTGSVLGPDGQPLSGVTALGLNAVGFGPRTLETTAFTLWGLDPDRPRSVVFYHPRRKLAALVVVRGEDKEPLQVRLQPLGSIRGRLVDPDGKPIAAAQIYLSFLDADGTSVRLPADPGKTDAGGRFQIGGIYPGLGFYLTIIKGNTLLVDGRKGPRLSLAGGETKDMGDVKAARADDN
jgi:hypothetical protein